MMRHLQLIYLVSFLFASIERHVRSLESEVSYNLRTIQIDDPFTKKPIIFEVQESLMGNASLFLVTVLEFCTTIITTYSSCAHDIFTTSYKMIGQEDLRKSIDHTILLQARELFRQKNLYNYQKLLENDRLHPDKQTFIQEICEGHLPQVDNIYNGVIVSIEQVLGNVKKPKSSSDKRFTMFLKAINKVQSHKTKGVTYEYNNKFLLDKSLCIVAYFNTSQCIDQSCRIDAKDVGIRFGDQSHKCTGSFDSKYAPLSPLLSYHSQFNFNYKYVDVSLQENFEFQEDFVFNIYNVEGCANLTHLFDMFEIFWSFLAFIKSSKLFSDFTKRNRVGILLSFLESPRCNTIAIDSPLYSFIRLVLENVLFLSMKNNIHVYVPSVIEFSNKFNISVNNENIKSYQNIIFPVKLQPLMANVMTNYGNALMKKTVYESCLISQPSSNDICEAETCIASSTPRKVVIAYRDKNRFIENLKDVIETIEEKLIKQIVLHADTLDRNVEVVNFGILQPCQQIQIIQQAKVFIYVHGAEGRFISFMSPNTIAIEIYPAGCGIKDFQGAHFYPSLAFVNKIQYLFFAGTIPSNTACKKWHYQMLSSFGCGIIVVIDLLEEFIDKVISLGIFSV